MEIDPVPFDPTELEGSIVQRLRRLAELVPDRRAISDGLDDVYTFGALIGTVEREARALLGRVPSNGRPVAVLLPHTPEALVAQLVGLAAGFVVMPLDATYPPEALRQQIATASPAGVIVSDATAELAAVVASGLPSHVLGGADVEEGALPERAGRDGAYLFYTSGTTGRPKGAVTTHRSFLAASRELWSHGVIGVGDRATMVAPLGFIASANMTLYTVLAGAEICVFDVRSRGLPAFVAWMRAARCTIWFTLKVLLRPVAAMLGPAPLEHLRLVGVGGEAVQLADVPVIRSLGAGPVDLMTVYSCSEMPLISWNLIRSDEPMEEIDPTSLGTPVEGSSIRLEPLDDASAADGLGEVVITAPIGMAGYLDEPDRTTSRFSFDEASDRMVYRIGDLGRRTARGGIELAGRVDSVVKIRNFSVHTGAVETALRCLDGVADVAVVAVRTSGDAPVLVGHVTPTPGADLDPHALRNHLRRELPGQMVPRHILVHSTLPMNERGKIDRLALERVDLPRRSALAAPPRSAVERRLADYWSSLLQVDDVGIDEDFFELGGDSLLALELLVFLEEEFGLWRPLSTWMDDVTIEEIAATIESNPSSERSHLVRLQAGTGGRPPLVFAYDLHGSAFRFRDLASAIGEDQEFWAFDSPLLAATPDIPGSVEDQARLHVEELLEAIPQGPYHLAGYSSGAFIVHAMARHLMELGHSVGFIGLLDFGPVHTRHRVGRHEGYRPPGAWRERARSDLPIARKAAHYLRGLRDAGPGRRIRYASRVLDVARRYDLLLARRDLRRHGVVRPELRLAFAWYRQLDHNRHYRPEPVRAAATLFRSEQTAKGNFPGASRRLDYASASDPELGWHGVFLDGFETVEVVGHHNDLVEPPYVAQVGRAIRRAFDRQLEREGRK